MNFLLINLSYVLSVIGVIVLVLSFVYIIFTSFIKIRNEYRREKLKSDN